jgi:hypothetical protein
VPFPESRGILTTVATGGQLHGPNLSRQLHCASRNRFPGRQRTWNIRPLSLSRTTGKPVPSLTLPEGSPQPAQQHRGSDGESMGYGSRRPEISGPLPRLRALPAMTIFVWRARQDSNLRPSDS